MNRMLMVCLMVTTIALSGPVLAGPYDADDNDATVSSGPLWQDQYSDPLVMPQKVRATGENAFIFSPRARQWGAYNAQGMLIAYGRANGGADHCADLGESCLTPVGKFRVTRKGPEECYSKTFPLDEGGGAAMPFCTFFKGGAAIHGSPQLSMMNGSHGCVRVTTEAAQWLYHSFMQVGTRVLVLPY